MPWYCGYVYRERGSRRGWVPVVESMDEDVCWVQLYLLRVPGPFKVGRGRALTEGRAASDPNRAPEVLAAEEAERQLQQDIARLKAKQRRDRDGV